MKSRNFLILGLIFCLTMLSGCCRKTAVPPSVSVHNQADSVREVIVERLVHIHDSIPFYVPIEKLVYVSAATDTSKLETSLAFSTAFVDSLGFLHHDLGNKEQTIWKPVDIDIPVSDTTHEEFHAVQDADTVYVGVPAQLSGGQKFLIKCGWGMIVTVVVLIGYLAYRLWRRRFK